MSKVRTYSLVILLVHGLLLALHDMAHEDLQVYLPTVKYLYAYPVMVFAPLLATIMLWTRSWRAGAWLFLLSMFGSFGFCRLSPLCADRADDHVFHAPQGRSAVAVPDNGGAVGDCRNCGLLVRRLGIKKDTGSDRSHWSGLRMTTQFTGAR